MKRAIKKILGLAGFELRRIVMQPPATTMQACLDRLRERGVAPVTLIDLGAARGEWTRMAKAVFPDSRALMVEPLQENEAQLQRARDDLPGVMFELAAAGNESGSGTFGVTADLDGSGFFATGERESKPRRVQMRTVDELAAKHRLKGAYLLKFDCHGFEVPILEGATRVLAETVAIVMECYTFQISPTSEPFWAMCARLEQLGFRPADVADVSLRPLDQMLWQMDLVFLKSDRREFQTSAYA